MAVPKRVGVRIKAGLKTFRRVLQEARKADRSEQDTVTIVTDLLAEVFGYDKYEDLTGEYSVRGTYCDLAVKVDGKIKYLIEVKAAGKSLKDHHLRQATDYAAKEGVEWVVLTNGTEWQAYKMIFEQPVRYEHVFDMNLLEDGSDLREKIFMLSREGISKQAIDQYHEQRQALNRFSLAAVVMSERLLNVIRRELRRISPGVRIETDDIKDVLRNEVLKRDLFDTEELQEAKRRVRQARGRKLAERKVAPVSSVPLELDRTRAVEGDKGTLASGAQQTPGEGSTSSQDG